ncbi:S24 family peptidase [Notoacmeibacter ruber]|nr:S24 family peptidase [Notoacmeibacter ruber]
MLQLPNAQDIEKDALVLVPTMEARASAGGGLIPETQDDAVAGYIAFEAAFLRSMGINPSFARLLDIEGDSMRPTLADGDKVVIDTSIDEVKADALYAVVYGDAVMVKRLQIQRDGSVLLKSDNAAAGYVDHHVAKHDLPDLRIVGRVRGAFSRL